VVRLSTRARQQVFLSGDSAIYSKWSVAGGDDGEENAAGGKLSNTIPKKHEKYQIFSSSDIAYPFLLGTAAAARKEPASCLSD
jgi:hypothetical protein